MAKLWITFRKTLKRYRPWN